MIRSVAGVASRCIMVIVRSLTSRSAVMMVGSAVIVGRRMAAVVAARRSVVVIATSHTMVMSPRRSR